MKLFFSALIILILFPIQSALASENNEIGIDDIFGVLELPQKTILEQLIQKWIENGKQNEELQAVIEHLDIVAKIAPELFLETMAKIPELQSEWIKYQERLIEEELEKLDLAENEKEQIRAASKVAFELQIHGQKKIFGKYASHNDVQLLEMNSEEFCSNLNIVADGIYTIDPDSGKNISIADLLKKSINSHPILSQSELANDPICFGFMIYLDSGSLYVTAVIPSENGLISVEQFCKIKTDKKICDRAEMFLTLAHMGMTKNPELSAKALDTFFIVVKDVDDASGNEYEEDIMYFESLSNFQPDDFLDEKWIRTQNGNYVTLDEASRYDLNQQQINHAKMLAKNLNDGEPSDKSKKIIKIIQIINDLNNN